VVLEILAADAASAWGLRPRIVIVDELAQWGSTAGVRTLWEAVVSALAKDPASRMAVITSAGDPAHWSREVLDHALTDPLWRVHEVPGPPPWMDEAKLEEQRRSRSESSFARLFLNRWTAAEDRLTNLEDLRACVVLDGPLEPTHGQRYVAALDLGIRHDRTVGVVAHAEAVFDAPEVAEPDEYVVNRLPAVGPPHLQLEFTERILREGPRPPRPPRPARTVVGHRVVLDRIAVWEGARERPVQLAEVEEWVAQAAAMYGAPVVFDPWQAEGMMQRLTPRGVRVERFNFTPASVGRLAATLYRLLRERALALPDDPDLIDELANVRLRETSPGVFRMDHDAGRHDDRAVALGMAAHHLLEQPVWDSMMFRHAEPVDRRETPEDRSWRQLMEDGLPWDAASLTGGLVGRPL
jgi:phage terminase large subunit-like protein